MKNLTLKLQAPKMTVVPNYFLDKYMPKANGEFVKVYLYLLRSASDTSVPLSVSIMADKLDHTEKDVIRALKYWEKECLLSITYDIDNTICGIELLAPEGEIALETAAAAAASTPDEASIRHAEAIEAHHEAQLLKAPDKIAYSTDELDVLTQSEDFKTLLYIAQSYIGKTLSSSDTDTLIYIYHTLAFPLDLTEYLIEYCVSLGHKSLNYIEKVALSWAGQGIKSVDEAKAVSTFYKKECYQVLKAFGITKRNPVDNEIAMITKWSKEYGLSNDIILEACNRTMQAIHQPSFEYADSILAKWSKAGVKHLSDIAILDEQHSKKRTTEANKALQSNTKPVVNKFNNMPSRSYIYEDLERQLLNQ